MNTLQSYLTENGISQADFAARIGVTQGTVSKLCAGTIVPRMRTAQAIHAATDGKVPVAAWAESVA